MDAVKTSLKNLIAYPEHELTIKLGNLKKPAEAMSVEMD